MCFRVCWFSQGAIFCKVWRIEVKTSSVSKFSNNIKMTVISVNYAAANGGRSLMISFLVRTTKVWKIEKRKNFLTSLTAVTIISKTKDKSRKTKSSVYRCMKIWLISILTWDELLSTLCPFSRLVTETILGLRRFCIATVYSEIGSLVAAQLCHQSHCNGAGALAATTSSKT